MNLREAATLALEALKRGDTLFYPETRIAIAALIEALAEQKCEHGVTDGSCKECYMAAEPVAWMYDCGNGGRMYAEELDGVEGWMPLYTSPPQRKPLTEEEIEQAYRHIYRNIPDDFDHTTISWIEQGIRYAEQAHGIKGET